MLSEMWARACWKRILSVLFAHITAGTQRFANILLATWGFPATKQSAGVLTGVFSASSAERSWTESDLQPPHQAEELVMMKGRTGR